jgi:teichuronic acid exporter
MSLKEKAVKGLFWSFVDNFSQQGIAFIIGIILARLLSPHEFGIIGYTTIFLMFSETFIDSGLGDALIRKKHCNQADYSTVFYYNFLIGCVLYLILFFSAESISVFLNEPQLKLIIRVLCVSIVISSFTLIQRIILIKRVDFKLQTKISIISSSVSGTVGIIMAYSGYGVWSLVVKALAGGLLSSLLLYMWNKWIPSFEFSNKSFKGMFSFGYKMLISRLIETIYTNIYSLIIGKVFSISELGLYTRANQFSNLPSANINIVISKVSYPVLVELRDNKEKLKSGYKKLIMNTTFITFVLMLGMAAVAEPMIITLIGEKWRNSIVYLQMLCVIGMLYPLHALNLNMLSVLGRSDLFLKLEIIKKVLAIPTIIIGVFFGIKIMLLGMMVNSIVSYYLNSYWSGKLIDYSMKEQIQDILPAFLLALSASIIVYFGGLILPFGFLIKLVVQILFGCLLIIFFSERFRLDSYLMMKSIVLTYLEKH